jgi:hypothetical protein
MGGFEEVNKVHDMKYIYFKKIGDGIMCSIVLLMFIKMFTVNYLLFLGCLQESNMQ